MLRKIIPLLLALVGLGIGAGAGIFLRPAPDPAASRPAGIAGPVKIPRDLNGADLARRLAAYGYSITRRLFSPSRTEQLQVQRQEQQDPLQPPWPGCHPASDC